MFIGAITTFGVISWIVKSISEYYCDEIEASESRKRNSIKEITTNLIKESEYNNRKIILTLLNEATSKFWDEVKMLRENKLKIKEQLLLHKNVDNIKLSSQLNKSSKNYICILYKSLVMNDVREYYWHRLIKKYSEKKKKLNSVSCFRSIRVKKNFFELPEIDQFLINIPIKNHLRNAKLIKRSNNELKFVFYDQFKGTIPNYNHTFFCKWETNTAKNLFVKYVDYYHKTVQIDIGMTIIIDEINKVGLDNYIMQPKFKQEVMKNNRPVGYILEYYGIDLFLPRKLVTNNSKVKKGDAIVRFTNEEEPQNLVVKQIA